MASSASSMGMANKAFRKTSQRTQLVPLTNGLKILSSQMASMMLIMARRPGLGGCSSLVLATGGVLEWIRREVPRPARQPDAFEQATQVCADSRIEIEIIGARLAGLGELAFQALQLEDQDASSANDVALGCRRVVDTTHVADHFIEQVLKPSDPEASAIAAGDQLMAIADSGALLGMAVIGLRRRAIR